MTRPFSRRTPADFTPGPWSRLAEARRRAPGLFDLTITNPKHLGLPGVEAALPGTPTSDYEPEPLGAKSARHAVARYFEERGHPTIDSHEGLEEGYIHGLGHGLGLDVHEALRFQTVQDQGDVLLPGAVFTIEPGLYYPSRGFGVRIEDTFYCTPDGRFESLTAFPLDLVIRLG